MRRPGLLWIAALAVVVSGCSGPDEQGPASGAGPLVSGGTAVLALGAEPDVLNPLINTSAQAGQVLALLLDGLVEMEEDFLYHPRIAEELVFSPDSLSITVRLRDWNWSDGSPLTSADVVRSFELFVDPLVASPRAGGRISNVAAVTALDERTVRYDFHRRRADQVATLGYALLSAASVAGLDPAEVRSWPLNQAPDANGLFALESWERGRHMVLRRNEAYPGPKPALDRVMVRFIPDETARLVALETGEVDVVDNVPPHQAARLSGLDGIEVAASSGRLMGMIYWNHELEMFSDRRVRKALSLAVDRKAFVDGLLSGYGSPAAGPLPPVLWAHDPSVKPDPLDLDRAAGLLDEAGWIDRDGDGVCDRDGSPLSFTILTRKGDPVRENGAVVLRENFAAVGVEVRTRILEFSTVIDHVRHGDFEAYLGVFSARLAVDPSGLLASDSFDRWNYGHYADARADSLMDLALSLTDREASRPVWTEFQRHCAEDQPMTFIYYPHDVVAHSSRLRGVRPHVLSPYQSIGEWWIPQDKRRYGDR
jgi:peptide/nickel transport system substrate-binding protein